MTYTTLNKITGCWMGIFLASFLLMIACQSSNHSHDQDKGENPAHEEEITNKAYDLFDGKTFTNWEGEMEHFRIEDNAIVAGSMEEKIPTNKFLCTEKVFGDFEMLIKAKFPTKNNNGGIQIRSRRIPEHHEVIGYQVDVGYSLDKAVWASIYDESRRRKFIAEAPEDRINALVRPTDFNDYKIRCEGRNIKVWFNGELVVDYTEEDMEIATDGIICVQIHGGPPSEAWYKDIQITEL
ncbi:MAG: DUF1080 domain-containing protein [Bacteroidota bacterium]